MSGGQNYFYGTDQDDEIQGSSDGDLICATQRGAELDLLLLRRGRRWGFEFKCTDAPRTARAMNIATTCLRHEAHT